MKLIGEPVFLKLTISLAQETIEEILGGPMPASGTLVKDHVSSLGKPFSEARTQLQAALDEVAK